MNGLVCRKGDELGIETPFNDAIVDAMHSIDDGTLPAGPTNVDLIIRAVGR